MKQLGILLKKDLLELYRTNKILILGIIFLLVGIMSPLFAFYTPHIMEMVAKEYPDVIIEFPDPTYIDSYMQLFKNISQIGLFVLIIVYSSLIVEERQKATYANLLINGTTRLNFILSKVIAQVIVFTIVYIASITSFLIYTAILFDTVFAVNFLIAISSYYVYSIFLIGIINLISSLSKTVITTIILNFLIFFILMASNFIPKIGKYLPNYLTTIANNSLINNDYLTYFTPNVLITLILFFIIISATSKLCSNID